MRFALPRSRTPNCKKWTTIQEINKRIMSQSGEVSNASIIDWQSVMRYGQIYLGISSKCGVQKNLIRGTNKPPQFLI